MGMKSSASNRVSTQSCAKEARVSAVSARLSWKSGAAEASAMNSLDSEGEPRSPRKSKKRFSVFSSRYSTRSKANDSGDIMASTTTTGSDTTVATFATSSAFKDDRLVIDLSRKGDEDQANGLASFVKTHRFDHLSAFLVVTNSIFIGFQVEFLFTTTEES